MPRLILVSVLVAVGFAFVGDRSVPLDAGLSWMAESASDVVGWRVCLVRSQAPQRLERRGSAAGVQGDADNGKGPGESQRCHARRESRSA